MDGSYCLALGDESEDVSLDNNRKPAYAGSPDVLEDSRTIRVLKAGSNVK